MLGFSPLGTLPFGTIPKRVYSYRRPSAGSANLTFSGEHSVWSFDSADLQFGTTPPYLSFLYSYTYPGSSGVDFMFRNVEITVESTADLSWSDPVPDAYYPPYAVGLSVTWRGESVYSPATSPGVTLSWSSVIEDRTGTGAAVLPFSVSAEGTYTQVGVATPILDFESLASAAHGVSGIASGVLLNAADASGILGVTGSGDSSLSFSAAALAGHGVSAAGTPVLLLDSSALGEVTDGGGEATLDLIPAALGARGNTGTAAVALTLTPFVEGGQGALGDASAPLSFVPAASGIFLAPTVGTASVPLSFVPAALGAHRVFGTATPTLDLVPHAVDQATYAAGTPALLFSASSLGATQVTGSVSVPFDLLPSGKAAFLVSGQADPALAFSVGSYGSILVSVDFQFDGAIWTYPTPVDFNLPARENFGALVDASWYGEFPWQPTPPDSVNFSWIESFQGGNTLLEFEAEAIAVHGVTGTAEVELPLLPDALGTFTPGSGGGGGPTDPPPGSGTLAGSIVCEGDWSTGHGTHPPRQAIAGADPFVFIDGRAVICEGDVWAEHPSDPDGPAHAISSNPVMFIEGRPVIVVGDSLTCGDTVATGSTLAVIT